MTTPKITPCIWTDSWIEDAANFYVSVFKDAKILEKSHYGEGGPQPKGSVLTMILEIKGQRLMLLNGGPLYKLSPAFSLSVSTEDQAETDYYWRALLEDGGRPSQCGWLADRFGLSWQIVPKRLPQLLGDPDRAKAQRVLAAMLQMQKIDVAALEKAAAS
ncbi:MAG: VOC family protein [Proteobacteria bacterium]|nr:VOC family protein [Pseudomonadota bacterium]